MGSDVRYTFGHRLPVASHSIEPFASTSSLAAATSNHQLFTVSINANGGSSSKHISRLAFEEQGPTSNNVSDYSRRGRPGRNGEKYEFPPTFTDHAHLARQRRAQLDSILDEGGHLRSEEHGWSWNQEDIYVRPSLLPKTPIAYPSGVGDDPLPSEQHPSYPFGRPITPRPHGSHPRASLPNPILTSRAFQNEAAAWNGVGAFAGSSGAAGEGTAGEIEMGGPSEAAGGGSSEALAKPLNSLPAYLARLRSTAIATSAASLGHASNLRAWPFPRFGPGPSLVKARAEDEDEDAAGGAAEAAREMWLELDLETLLPVGRERDPLDYLSSRTSKLVGNSSAEEIQREQMLDAIEADLEARLAAEATAAAHRGEPAEGNNVEAEATSDLRRLFASQGEQSVVSRPTALARSVDEAIDRQAQATGAATATTTTTTSATSGRDDPLPSFLLDEYGGDAEELRNLLASAASARSTSQARGWASEDASPDAFGDGPTTRWFARARQAAQDRETRPPSGLTSAMLGGGSGHRDATSLLARGR